MKFKKIGAFFYILVLTSLISTVSYADVTYLLEESTPTLTFIDGIVRPTDDTIYDGDLDLNADFYSNVSNNLLLSSTENVTFSSNYFSYIRDYSDVLISNFGDGVSINLMLTLYDGAYVLLPFASVPMVVKSYYSNEAYEFYDEDIISIDYDNGRIGIGTSNPQEALSIKGTVNVTGTYGGNGSLLLNIPYKGSDYYNALFTEDESTVVVTVNSTGLVMIGGQAGVDIPSADLTVYGSLYVQSNNNLSSDMITGAGSRWAWNSDDSILRIGYVPSYYWDPQFSGDNSIAFGYATMATGNYSIVTGGYYNIVRNSSSIITGGSENEVYYSDSVILGGQRNIIYESDSIILGGQGNRSESNSIILGGRNNYAFGSLSIVSGYNNSVDGDGSFILSGQDNTIVGENSMGIGSYLTINHDQAIIFSTYDETISSNVSQNVAFLAENGVGINTADTESDYFTISGSIYADNFIGDGADLINVKASESVFELLNLDTIYYEGGKMGVGSSNLVESFIVSGSLYLTGNAVAVEGAVRYFNNVLSVYVNDEWVTLTMEDTNSTFNVYGNLSIEEYDTSIYKIFITTSNATFGQVLRWDGDDFMPDYVDPFIESPLDEYASDVTLAKRLYLDSGYVSIGTENVTDYPFYLETSDSIAAYFEEDSDFISLSVDSVGLSLNDEGGFYLDSNSYLRLFVEDMSNSAISMMYFADDVIGIDGLYDTSIPFYVNGDLGANKTIFTDTNSSVIDAMIINRDYYDDDENGMVLYQDYSGSSYFQSGPEDYQAPIHFHQGSSQVAKLLYTSSGVKFGLTPTFVRSGFDIFNGHIHVDSGYGIGFNYYADQYSQIKFDSGVTNSIYVYTDEDYTVPILSISASTNIGVNAIPSSQYDLIISANSLSQTALQIDSISTENQSISLMVNSQASSYEIGNQSDNDFFIANNGAEIFTVSKNIIDGEVPTVGYVGIYDPTPNQALSVGKDIAISDQSSIYMMNVNERSVRSIYPSSDILVFNSSADIQIFGDINTVATPAMIITTDNVGIYGSVTDYLVDSEDNEVVNFQVNGTMNVMGFIEDTDGQLTGNVFPLTVLITSNIENDFEERTVDTLIFDTGAGIRLSETDTDLAVPVGSSQNPVFISYVPYYDSIYFADSLIPTAMYYASANDVLSFVGDGIRIVVSSNVNDEGTSLNSTAGFNMDTLFFMNELYDGDTVSGDLEVIGTINVDVEYIISRDATYITMVNGAPWARWQLSTYNTLETDLGTIDNNMVGGKVWYLGALMGKEGDGNVGIGIPTPSYDLEVSLNAAIHSTTNVTENLNVFWIDNNEPITSLDSSMLVDVAVSINFELTDDLFIGRQDVSRNFSSTSYSDLMMVRDGSMSVGTNNQFEDFDSELLIYNMYSAGFFNDVADGDGDGRLDLVSSLNQEVATFSIQFDATGDSFGFEEDASTLTFSASDMLAVYVRPAYKKNDFPSLFISSNNSGIGIMTDEVFSRNVGLTVSGNMSIGFGTSRLPDNSLAVDGQVAVGFGTGWFSSGDGPDASLIVSQSVMVGNQAVDSTSGDNKTQIYYSDFEGAFYLNSSVYTPLMVNSTSFPSYVDDLPAAFINGNILLDYNVAGNASGVLNFADYLVISSNITQKYEAAAKVFDSIKLYPGTKSYGDLKFLTVNKNFSIRDTDQEVVFRIDDDQKLLINTDNATAGDSEDDLLVYDDDFGASVLIASNGKPSSLTMVNNNDSSSMIAVTNTLYGDDSISKGLQFDANSEQQYMANESDLEPELVITSVNVGINTSDLFPTLDYTVNVVGTVNISGDFFIADGLSNDTNNVGSDLAVAGIKGSQALSYDSIGGFSTFEPVPSGVIIMWQDEVIPSGWVVCEGDTIDYYNVITGYNTGNSDSGTYTVNGIGDYAVPDLKGMMVRSVIYDDATDSDGNGGADTYTSTTLSGPSNLTVSGNANFYTHGSDIQDAGCDGDGTHLYGDLSFYGYTDDGSNNYCTNSASINVTVLEGGDESMHYHDGDAHYHSFDGRTYGEETLNSDHADIAISNYVAGSATGLGVQKSFHTHGYYDNSSVEMSFYTPEETHNFFPLWSADDASSYFYNSNYDLSTADWNDNKVAGYEAWVLPVGEYNSGEIQIIRDNKGINTSKGEGSLEVNEYASEEAMLMFEEVYDNQSNYALYSDRDPGISISWGANDDGSSGFEDKREYGMASGVVTKGQDSAGDCRASGASSAPNYGNSSFSFSDDGSDCARELVHDTYDAHNHNGSVGSHYHNSNGTAPDDTEDNSPTIIGSDEELETDNVYWTNIKDDDYTTHYTDDAPASDYYSKTNAVTAYVEADGTSGAGEEDYYGHVGKEHQHYISNIPDSQVMIFIMKVDE